MIALRLILWGLLMSLSLYAVGVCLRCPPVGATTADLFLERLDVLIYVVAGYVFCRAMDTVLRGPPPA